MASRKLNISIFVKGHVTLLCETCVVHCYLYHASVPSGRKNMLYIYLGQVGNMYTLRRTHCHRVIQRDQINNSLRTHFTQLHHFCLHQHMKRAHLPMAAMPKTATQDESSMLAVEFKTRSILHRPDTHAGPKQSQHTMKKIWTEKRVIL